MQDRFKMYPDINLGVSKLTPGRKSIEELLDLATKFRQHEDFSSVHYQLTDLRGCIFDFKPGKINEMKSLMEKYQQIDNQKLGVYLVDKPMETAYIILFFQSIKQNREFCSTAEKAYEILSLPISFDHFISLISI